MCNQVQEEKKNGKIPIKGNLLNSSINKLLSNKRLFPFQLGINRFLFVLWIGVSCYVEVSLWKVNDPYYESYIANYGWGIVALFAIAIVYRILLWIYEGFKSK